MAERVLARRYCSLCSSTYPVKSSRACIGTVCHSHPGTSVMLKWAIRQENSSVVAGSSANMRMRINNVHSQVPCITLTLWICRQTLSQTVWQSRAAPASAPAAGWPYFRRRCTRNLQSLASKRSRLRMSRCLSASAMGTPAALVMPVAFPYVL